MFALSGYRDLFWRQRATGWMVWGWIRAIASVSDRLLLVRSTSEEAHVYNGGCQSSIASGSKGSKAVDIYLNALMQWREQFFMLCPSCGYARLTEESYQRVRWCLNPVHKL